MDPPVEHDTPPAAEPARPVRPCGQTTDGLAHLAEVYRDFPGLRALILRRVHDPEVAADILQDAAVTTLEKLRDGAIANPEVIGGYLYRVALNHVRNYRRKDRTALSSPAQLESLPAPERDIEWDQIGCPQWATAARRVLEELKTPRDRELLVRFYLNDEGKESICAGLGLSEEHFHRVIFRARNRFRALLENRGYRLKDFLSIAAVGLCLAVGGATAFHRELVLPDPPSSADRIAMTANPAIGVR
jgi:RNA polymerase sigma-70 factor (ECF subfamily)